MNNFKSREEKLKFAKDRIKQYRLNGSFIHPSVNIPEHVIIGKNVIIMKTALSAQKDYTALLMRTVIY